MTLQPSTANFSLINYSQEKDLNNLVAARKHQKNPEKLYCETPNDSPKSNHPQENNLIVKKIGGKILPESFVFLSFFIPYTM